MWPKSFRLLCPWRPILLTSQRQQRLSCEANHQDKEKKSYKPCWMRVIRFSLLQRLCGGLERAHWCYGQVISCLKMLDGFTSSPINTKARDCIVEWNRKSCSDWSISADFFNGLSWSFMLIHDSLWMRNVGKGVNYARSLNDQSLFHCSRNSYFSPFKFCWFSLVAIFLCIVSIRVVFLWAVILARDSLIGVAL